MLLKEKYARGKMSEAEYQEKLVDKARDLESVLISSMVEPMFPEGRESGLYGGGQGNSVYRSMMVQEYGKILSKSNGLGVAENITKQLNRNRSN